MDKEQWRSTSYEKLGTARPVETYNTAEGTFRGLAASWSDIVQSFEPTRIEQGAFSESMRQRGPSAIKVLFQHDTDRPVGKLLSASESARGVEVVGQLSRLSSFDDYLQMMRDGLLALSIGFNPEQVSYQPHPDYGRLRIIHKLDWIELSLVTFQASPSAVVEEVYRRSQGPRSPAHELVEPEIQWAESLLQTPRPSVVRAAMIDPSVEIEREERPTWQREWRAAQAQARAEGRLRADGSIIGGGPYVAQLAMKAASMEEYLARERERLRSERDARFMWAITSQCIPC
jgi:uncharacterized protein